MGSYPLGYFEKVIQLIEITILKSLEEKKYEYRVAWIKAFFYQVERLIGNLFFKRFPPDYFELKLLNLGCGPLIYEGWCNADDYAFKRSIREKSFRPQWRLDLTKKWSCKDDFWGGVFSQHVIEHLSYSEAVHVFKECLRTLKCGAYLRISVPSLENYINFYNGEISAEQFKEFPFGALAMSYISQMHGHKSLWDAKLLKTLLSEIGYSEVRECGHLQSSDERLCKDQDVKEWESLYVEARKPLT